MSTSILPLNKSNIVIYRNNINNNDRDRDNTGDNGDDNSGDGNSINKSDSYKKIYI